MSIFFLYHSFNISLRNITSASILLYNSAKCGLPIVTIFCLKAIFALNVSISLIILEEFKSLFFLYFETSLKNF